MRTSNASRLCLAIVLVGTSACSRAREEGKDSQSQQTQTHTTSGTVGAGQQPIKILDEDITGAVKRVFRQDKLLGSQKLGVDTADGIVALTGTVNDILAASRATEAAETIKGVRSVVNRVAVVPAPRSDESIRSDVVSTLHNDPATKSLKVDVSVRDGAVTVTGTTDSWSLTKLVTEDAERIPGVAKLTNDMTVKVVALRPPTELLAVVKDRLANDVWLDGSALEASVDGRTVRLHGAVASVGAKERAHDDAAILGIQSVDDSGVTVDWSAQNKLRRASPLADRSDADVSRAVQDAFKEDPRLARVEPAVAVHDGAVTLSGTVDSARARKAAENDAKNTLGAWRIIDDAVVGPAGAISDADLERGAKRALSEDPFSGDTSQVTIHARNGKVTLGGTTKGDLQRLDIDTDVGSVPGVKTVEDDLIVKIPPSDVGAEIDANLYWDPLVDSGQVHVAVDPGGVATLTGDVDTWGEAWAATQDALHGGASGVVNLLKVKGRADAVPPGASTPAR